MYKTRKRKHLRRFTCFLGIIILSLPIFLIYLSPNNNIANDFYINENVNKDDDEEIPKNSATWGWVNLTNYMINETRYFHNNIIPIEGRLFFLPTNASYEGESVSLKVDGVILSQFTDITNEDGEFRFDYIIPNSSNIYTDHKFEAFVNNPGKTVIYLNYFIINFKSYSIFANVIHNASLPLLIGEELSISGDLRLLNGSIIPSERIDYYWLDGTTILAEGFFNSDTSGSFRDITIGIPNTFSNPLTLMLNYSGNDDYIQYTETSISNITVFSNITWDLNIENTATEGQEFTLRGTLLSSTDPSLRISNREIEIFYNGSIANTTSNTITTASDGSFSVIIQIPEGNGTASLQAQLINNQDLDIRTPLQYISVEARPPTTPRSPGGVPPFLLFSSIFFPIVASIGVALGVFGFFYYRKREKESRVVHIPLESRIENFKILKDSGRLEESISYLYNAIYMDLINAKYNRKRNVNETIRDFAIISVKELKLTPSSIYPFIQKVEEIIYAKPFKILEQDFYNTCDLFSPIYFQLTGHNFVLNF